MKIEADDLPIPVPQRSGIRKSVLGQMNRREEQSAWEEEVAGDLPVPQGGGWPLTKWFTSFKY